MTQHPPRSRWVRTNRWLRRLTLAAAACFLFYAGFQLLGFVPVNGNYVVPPDGDRVRIFIRSKACGDAAWRGDFVLSEAVVAARDEAGRGGCEGDQR